MDLQKNITPDDKMDIETDFSMAKTQPNSSKELQKLNAQEESLCQLINDSEEKVKKFATELNSLNSSLKDLMHDYFHRPLIHHLKSGMGPSHSPFVYLLDAMHKTQQQIKTAIEANLQVAVRVPNPVFLTSTKPVLVIDLDETLVHSANGRQDGEQVFTIKTKTQGRVSFTVTVRPFAREFLRSVKEHYTLILFTASDKAYADKVLKLIDPNDEIFDLKLYKQSCLSIDNKFNVKDLRMFRNIALHDIIILDNNPICYLLQPGNAIPITSFYFDLEDIELKKLAAILKHIAPLENKQEALRSFFYKELISNLIKFDDLVSSILNNSIDI